MRIFVGNLAYTTTEEELRQLFYGYGSVAWGQIITDQETGRSRGFGFVDMPHVTQAQAVIAGLDGTSLGGRTLTVNEARQQQERRPRGEGEGGMRIFVGNVPFTTTGDELVQLFATYCVVRSVQIMQDRETGQPRGFGFVDMPNDLEAQAAIASLQGKRLGGRMLTINEAHPREGERPRRPRWEGERHRTSRWTRPRASGTLPGGARNPSGAGRSHRSSVGRKSMLARCGHQKWGDVCNLLTSPLREAGSRIPRSSERGISSSHPENAGAMSPTR